MDKIKLFVALGLFLGTLASCQNNVKHEAELNQIDSMEVVVKGYYQRMDSLSEQGLTELSTHVDTQYNYILNNYPDSSDRDFWLKDVAYFGEIQKSLNRFEENEKDLRQEIDYSLHQLKTLENSIRDKKLTEEEMEQYIRDEKIATHQLYMRLRKTVLGTERAYILWDSLGPAYDSIAGYVRTLP